jgi:hypothetical protein
VFGAVVCRVFDIDGCGGHDQHLHSR